MRFTVVVLLFLAPAPVFAQEAASQDAALKKRINQAIDKGVDFLKKQQTEAGFWKEPDFYPQGTTALAAWTLLESGVPAKDPAIQKAAAYLREAALGLTKNYDISLAIIFFDRLEDPKDEPLIDVLTVRLLSGMTSFASWSYDSPPLDSVEAARLRAYLQWIKAKPAAKPKTEVKEKAKPGAKPKTEEPRQLSPFILQQLAALRHRPPPKAGGDNSNTHFALMALWVARRHGLPVDGALSRVEARFRAQQLDGGSWGYPAPFKELPGRGSMTCVGLLALAVGHGANLDKRALKELSKDPQVKAGLNYLAKFLRDQKNQTSVLDTYGYYFFFSLERLAVIYDIATIEGEEWYPSGANTLVSSQKADGSWGRVPRWLAVDTSFALLFLKRANIASDLTEILKGNPPRKSRPKVAEDPFDHLPLIIPKDDKPKKDKAEPAKESRGAGVGREIQITSIGNVVIQMSICPKRSFKLSLYS